MLQKRLKTVAGRLRIIMVDTTHPGNIGAAARAMKAMCLKRLYLVNPKIFPSVEVTARAAGADDLLADAVVCESLSEALQDCALVIATTARERRIPWSVYGPRQCAAKILQATATDEVAVVFGRESSGLTNKELELCNAVLQIPTNPQFSSLNVASAIQILCYEVMQMSLNEKELLHREPEAPLATADQMQHFYTHLEQGLTDIGFYDPEKPRQLMHRLKRFFNRSQPDQNEMNLLRGILTAMQKSVGNKNNDN